MESWFGLGLVCVKWDKRFFGMLVVLFGVRGVGVRSIFFLVFFLNNSKGICVI